MKSSFLTLTNKILNRIGQANITDVETATGQAVLIKSYINEAILHLYSEDVDWYDLFRTRLFTTPYLSAATISFTSGYPATIADSGNSLNQFLPGMDILVSGSTSNDGVYRVDSPISTITISDYSVLSGTTVTIVVNRVSTTLSEKTTITTTTDWTASTDNTTTGTSLATAVTSLDGITATNSAGVLTITCAKGYSIDSITYSAGSGIAYTQGASLRLQVDDAITDESAGATISITTVSYPTKSGFGRSHNLLDITNNRELVEDAMTVIDSMDPDESQTGPPAVFALVDGNYRFFPIPSGAIKCREKYWKLPDTLVTNSDEYDLPIETENCIISWAWVLICLYLETYDKSDRLSRVYSSQLKNAITTNDKRIAKLFVKGSKSARRGFVGPPVFPPQYGVVSR